MQQQRVCGCLLHAPCHCLPGHADGFLGLPLPIRERIYKFAGLFIDEEIWLPAEPWRKDRIRKYNTTSCLLRVSKAVHHEVEGILYSRNCFFVWNCRQDQSLLSLARLSPRACWLLRDLVVSLHFRKDGEKTWHLGDRGFEQHLSNRELVETWQEHSAHILEKVRPRHLRLRLACGTSDTGIINRVLEPLRRFPSTLGDLDLIFSRERDPNLVALARDAITQLAPKQEPSSETFRFFDLPADLRWQIYQYTDLAMPLKEVQWTPHGGFEVACTTCKCRGRAGLSEHCPEQNTIHYCQLRLRCPTRATRFPSCSKGQSAASHKCRHFKGTLSILLASRAMYEEAIAFFYSYNRVTVLPNLRATPTHGRPSVIYKPPEENALKLFVKRLSRPEVLRHLRQLEFIYPGLDPRTPEALKASAAAFREDWVQAVEYIAKYANLPSLKFTMHLYKSKVQRLFDVNGEPFPAAEESYIFAAYADILAPLAQLSELGIGGFRLHLEWPTNYYSPKHQMDMAERLRRRNRKAPNVRPNIPDVNWDTVKMEGKLGKLVMGEVYENQALQSTAQSPSQTLRCLWDGRVTRRPSE
jgi:hypothetical protein